MRVRFSFHAPVWHCGQNFRCTLEMARPRLRLLLMMLRSLLALVLIALLSWVRWRRSGRGISFRDGAGDVLRICVLTLLVSALAGPLFNSRSVGTDVVFLLDTSESVAPGARRRALDFVNRAKAYGEDRVRTALVAFGADAAKERSLTLSGSEVSSLNSSVSTSATDIGLGLELALSAFQGSATRRIVLFSDGQENLGDSGSAVAMAKSMGVEVSVAPLPTRAKNDNVRMHGLVLPSDVRAREPFSIRVHVDSADDDNVELDRDDDDDDEPSEDTWIESNSSFYMAAYYNNATDYYFPGARVEGGFNMKKGALHMSATLAVSAMTLLSLQ